MTLFTYFSPPLLWLSAGLLLLLIELAVPGLFFFISFALGSVFGALAAWLGYSFLFQSGIAIGVALIQFNAMRRALRQFTQSVQAPTNTHALLGKRGVVTEAIAAHKPGLVKIGGEAWSASSEFNCDVDSVVKVLRVEGNKVVVTLDYMEG